MREPQFEVGYQYHPNITTWDEWVDLNYRKRQIDDQGVLDLRLFCKNLTSSTVQSVAAGRAAFSLANIDGYSFFLYQFDNMCGDTAFHESFVPPDDRAPLPEPGDETFAMMFVTLINADNGIVEAIRYIQLTKTFAIRLYRLMRHQLNEDVDERFFIEGVNELHDRYPTFMSLMNKADAVCMIEPRAIHN